MLLAWTWVPAVWLAGGASWPSEGTSQSPGGRMGLRCCLLPGGSGGIEGLGPVLTLGSLLWTLAILTDTTSPGSPEQRREGPWPRTAFQQRGGWSLRDVCLEGRPTWFCGALPRPEIPHEN